MGDGAAAREGGVGTPPETYFGLPHVALGSAALGLDSSGELRVAGIGSSGLDGVEIHLGSTTGFALRCDLGTSGGFADGSVRTIRPHFTGSGITTYCDLSLTGDASQNCDITLAIPATLHATSVRVVLLDGAVAQAISLNGLPPGEPVLDLVSGNFGSSPGTTSDPTLQFAINPGTLTIRYFAAPGAHWLAAVPGSPPVLCDQVVITIEGLPPVPMTFTQCDIRCSDLDNNEFMISDERLNSRNKGGYDLTPITKGGLRAIGDATLTGIAGDDICAGCLECCLPGSSDALVQASGVVVRNLTGSSGLDGVEFAMNPWGSPWSHTELELRCSPLDLTAPSARCILHASGTFSDASTRSLAVELENVGGALSVECDSSSLGSVEALLQVSLAGSSVGSVLTPNAGAPIATLLPGAGTPLALVRCETLDGAPGTGQPGMTLHFDSTFVMIAAGELLIGDALTIRCADSSLHVTRMDSLQMRCDHVGAVTLTGGPRQSNDTSGGATTIVHTGLVHHALGQATLTSTGSHGYGTAELHVHGIGSSGLDGVEVDVARSAGAKFDCRVAPDTPGIRLGTDVEELHISLIDEQCATCPGGVMANLSVDTQAPGKATITATVGAGTCCRGHVTLMKLVDDAESSTRYSYALPYGDGTGWSICADDGSQLVLRYHQWGWNPVAGSEFNPAAGEGRLTMRMIVGQVDAKGTVTGVTATHPLHGTFTNIDEILLSRCDDLDFGLVDRLRMVAKAPAGTTSVLKVKNTDVAVTAGVYCALGQTRLLVEDCDDRDPTFSPTLWAANIGSSGNDGVQINLPAVQRERRCDTVTPLGKSKGGSVTFRPSTGTWHRQSYGLIGSLSGDENETSPLASVEIISGSGGLPDSLVCDQPWAPESSIRATVRDVHGSEVVSINGLPPGEPVIDLIAPSSALTYIGACDASVTGKLAGGGEIIESTTQTLTWGDDVMFIIRGQPPVFGRSLELHGTPNPGTTVQCDLVVHALVVGGQTNTGASGAIGISGMHVLRMPTPPPCSADIQPYATNGDGVVNVSDLLAVIGSWGACPNCAYALCLADINRDCMVNVTDLLAVIGSWGACP